MSKMVAQIVPLMKKKEIDQLIITHYENESQTLTSDSEANLLKLKDICGQLSDADMQRWEQIIEIFNKNNKRSGVDKSK